ncbi:MAG: hypothetical protein AB1589_33365 [Cyanobacteriota bacterium]
MSVSNYEGWGHAPVGDLQKISGASGVPASTNDLSIRSSRSDRATTDIPYTKILFSEFLKS